MNEFLNRIEEKKREDTASEAFWDEVARERHKIAQAVAKTLDEGFRARGINNVTIQLEGEQVQLRRAQDWMNISCTDVDQFMTECAVEPGSLPAILGTQSHLEPLRNRKQMLDDVIRWVEVK